MQAHIIILSMITNAALAHLRLACNTLEGHATATNYINQFLQENNFPDLDQLTEEHMKGVNLSNLFENIGIWFSSSCFRTNQNTWFGNVYIKKQFKRMKEVFKCRLPTHKVFAPIQHDWFAELKIRFKKSCKHCWIEDTNVFEVRKS